MGMSVGGSGKVRAEPNVVPMIDIMLVILIIFMVIIPQIVSGFNATPPKGINLKRQQEDDQDQVLGIDQFGQYFLNKQEIPNAALPDSIRAIYSRRQNEDAVIFVRADKDLEYGKVLEALDIVSKHGVRVAGMISDQSPGTTSSVPGDNPAAAPAKPGGGD